MANSATVRLFFVTVHRHRPKHPPPTFEDVRRRLHYNSRGERLAELNYVISLRNGRELVQVPQGASIPPPYMMVMSLDRLRIRPGKPRRPPLA